MEEPRRSKRERKQNSFFTEDEYEIIFDDEWNETFQEREERRQYSME